MYSQDTTSPVTATHKPKKFSKEWLKKKMNFACVSGAKDVEAHEDEDEEIVYKPNRDQEKEEMNEESPVRIEVNEALKTEEIGKEDEPAKEDIVDKIEEAVPAEDDSIYEAINVKEPQEVEREETPDPLQRIAAKLHGQLQGYRADFDQFSNLMEEHRPLDTESEKEPEVKEVERKLSREEEISLVSKMSKQDAWSHVMSQVYEVCFILN